MDAGFKKFASKANGTEITSMDINKWAKDAGVLGKNLTSNHIDIAFSKVAKGAKTLKFSNMDAMIGEMAQKYKDDKKLELDAAKAQLMEKMGGADSKMHGTTAASNVGGVDRLTDTSKYTGSHKERFDESGKGKGMAGREDVQANTGYVGNYKGAGTYEKSH